MKDVDAAVVVQGGTASIVGDRSVSDTLSTVLRNRVSTAQTVAGLIALGSSATACSPRQSVAGSLPSTTPV